MIAVNIPQDLKYLRRHYPTARGNAGYVYLITDEAGLFKIGKTGDMRNRAYSICKVSGRPLVLLHVIYTENRHRREQELLTQFSSKHIGHEWFTLDSDDVEYIKGLAT